MKRVKSIYGKVMYMYRGRYMLDKPDEFMVKKMMYDEEEKKTYVYLKKKTYFIDILCILILIGLVGIKISDFHYMNKINYDETPIAYHGNLYLNVHNDVNSYYDINVSLMDRTKQVISSNNLSPNGNWIIWKYSDVEDLYYLEFTYDTYLGLRTTQVPIRPIVIE